ncbi:MAG TPA: hypothetical protein VF807_09955, partial [Ktedonobacterales bacterium]
MKRLATRARVVILIGGLLLVLVAGALFTQLRGMTFPELQAAVRAAGAEVSVQVTPDQRASPLVSGAPHGLLINGSAVSVYDYTFIAQADLDARGISADGTQMSSGIGPTRRAIAVDWIAPPHWFKRGRVIVLYVGS